MSGTAESQRLFWLDSAKGIGILLVVIGHMLYFSNCVLLQQFIYSFHVPLFFMLSGLLQKPKLKEGHVLSKARQLLVPFFIYALIGIPFWAIIYPEQIQSPLLFVFELFYIQGVIHNEPLWYLIVLFEVHALMSLIKLPQKGTKTLLVALVFFVLMAFVMYVCFDFTSVFNWFGFNRMVVCTVFYIFGLLMRKVLLNRITNRIREFLLMLVSFSLCLLVVLFNGSVSVYRFELGSFPLYCLSAVSGSLFVIFLCRLFFDRKNVLVSLSRFGILLLGTQYFLIIPFRGIMERLNLLETTTFSVIAIMFGALILFAIPFLFVKLEPHFKYIKVLNGEFNFDCPLLIKK